MKVGFEGFDIAGTHRIHEIWILQNLLKVRGVLEGMNHVHDIHITRYHLVHTVNLVGRIVLLRNFDGPQAA